jgi:transcriptional regulator with XRE-family HTH domain
VFISTARDWGNVVRDRRLEVGMTQQGLAELVGRKRQWVVRFETGYAGSASTDDVLKMLDVLGLLVEVEVDPSFNDPEPVYMNPSNPDPWESRA